ncbi:hypothetical protein BCR44DRAFT_56092 [Catenaria anguillulae PL171]|uniref:P-loop containing nucleoside triphosphate hydrolase protein n=1 Tax=Catenaria anguillulae PL171 TaxID=765915 RepID=A0A1Y2I4H1_9FUNG|nr:hypothetical protein BCR44DRAFT_56092 [Catenaria anguillulae PL171]
MSSSSLANSLCPDGVWSPYPPGVTRPNDFSPCFRAWILTTALPLGVGLASLALYWAKYRRRAAGYLGYSQLSADTPDSYLDEELETAVLEGGTLIPAAGAQALKEVNSKKSAARALMLASIGLYAVLQAVAAVLAGSTMDQAVFGLHFGFAALLFIGAERILPSRIFPVVVVLIVDMVSSLINLRSILLNVSQITLEHAIPIASSASVLLALVFAALEYNRVTHAKQRVILATSNGSTSTTAADGVASTPAPMSLEPFASLLQIATFSWFTPLVHQGYTKPLEINDVWDLAVADKSVAAVREHAQHVRPGRAAWVSIALTVKWLMAYQVFAGVSVSMLALAGPFFLNRLLSYLEGNFDPVTTSPWTPYFYVFGMFLCSSLSSLFAGQTYFTGRRVGTRVRAILNSLLFRKTLSRNPHMMDTQAAKKAADASAAAGADHTKESNKSEEAQDESKEEEEEEESPENRTTESDVNVLVATDIGRILDYVCYIQYLFSTPIQLVLCIGSLYMILGWSALTGVAILAFMIPMQTWLGKIMESQQDKVMTATDARVKKMTEVLQGIQIIKFFAWESKFLEIIQSLRSKEIGKLRRYWLTMAGVNQLYHMVPTLVTLVTFFCYAGIAGEELSATKVFTSLSLFQVLRMPLWDLPDQIIRFYEVRVSVYRVQSYLDAPDLVDYTIDTSAMALASQPTTYGSFADNHPVYIGCRNATMRWPRAKSATAASTSDAEAPRSSTSSSTDPLIAQQQDNTAEDANGSAAFALRDLNVQFPRGKLTVILGGTGQGKSTLLHGLLGELDLVNGQVYMPRVPIAYVPQQSWLLNATIRENILFSSPYDEARYQSVIHACALTRDLEILDGGDSTQIGERGVALSGGQKQRCSLARAVYANCDVTILDDVLSAVDAPTAAHLFHECILGELKGKTRVLVSHAVGLVAPHADHLIYLKDGRAVAEGDSIQEVAKMLLAQGFDEEAASLLEVATPSVSRRGSMDEDTTQVDNKKSKSKAKSKGEKTKSSDDSTAETPAANQLIKDEEKASGSVSWSVYAAYISATGGAIWWVILLLSIAIPQCLNVGQDWWLKEWAQQYTEAANILSTTASSYLSMSLLASPSVAPSAVGLDAPVDSRESALTQLMSVLSGRKEVNLAYYMSVYAGLCAFNVIIQYAFNVLEVFVTLRGGIKMHNDLLFRVLSAPITFFQSQPIGRQINRFSKDQQTIDREVMGSMVAVIWCLSSVILVITMVSVISPLFLLFVAPLGFAYKFISGYYLSSSRELKRLESVTRSPILSQFQETSTGTSVVRAFRREMDFVKRAHDRMDIHHRPFFALWVANRWLSIRLDFLSNIVIMACGLAILISGNLYAGTAGIALSWVMGISDSCLWLVRMHAQMEMNLNSVERFQEYMQIEQEPTEGSTPSHWPTRGDLTVHNLTMRYPSSTSPVLRGISFSVPGKTKIGVVGRTGAGKSSLALALLRMLEAEDGYVEIDGVRTRDLNLSVLRSRVTMVQQDPVLFEGSLRSNLDVLNEHDDASILNALERVHFFESTQSTNNSSVFPADSAVQSRRTSVSSLAGPSDSETAIQIEGGEERVSSSGAAANSVWTLDSHVAPGGKNLSVGQRQLISLARALLRRSKVIIMDESTANVSHDLDARIQKTIREEFSESTILVIAHRLRTVCDFDKILVLDHGQVVEFGSPFELMNHEGGTFHHMCKESGEWDYLWAMSRRAAGQSSSSTAALLEASTGLRTSSTMASLGSASTSPSSSISDA